MKQFTAEANLNSTDRVIVASEVLVTVVRQAAMEVEGVIGMAPVAGGVNRLLRRGKADGVVIEVTDQTAKVQLHLRVAAGCDMHGVSRSVQSEVARSMHNIVGIDVVAVDVFVDDVAFHH
ncbi:MAG: Asp23/Gls24 family envelope stress response protein [Chloroflexi bacterium]|nr:Asp23/Gls24 family envelope stress response protein [Chloroflexota bacterium]